MSIPDFFFFRDQVSIQGMVTIYSTRNHVAKHTKGSPWTVEMRVWGLKYSFARGAHPFPQAPACVDDFGDLVLTGPWQ